MRIAMSGPAGFMGADVHKIFAGPDQLTVSLTRQNVADGGISFHDRLLQALHRHALLPVPAIALKLLCLARVQRVFRRAEHFA